MALETNGAYLDSVTAMPDTGSVNWDKRFQASETEYTLRVAENAKNVTLSFKAPAGCTMKIGNDIIDGTYVADVSSGKAEIKNCDSSGYQEQRIYIPPDERSWKFIPDQYDRQHQQYLWRGISLSVNDSGV